MRIIEVGDSVESAKAGRVLLQLGNALTKIEDRAQRHGLRRSKDGAAPYLHLALDPGKESVALDFAHADAAELLRTLVGKSDGAVVAHGAGKALWERAGIGATPPALVFAEPAP